MKKYDVYYSGGEKIKTIQATCITNACKEFIETLEKPANYKLNSKDYASIIYADNFSICSDFVVVKI